jgi:hypothetical protein
LHQPQRRFLPRASFQIPLRLRYPRNDGTERVGQSINLCMNGAYFSADLVPKVGELMDVFIEIPKEMTGKETGEQCFVAKVIHVEADRPVAGRSSIGVKFLCYT